MNIKKSILLEYTLKYTMFALVFLYGISCYAQDVTIDTTNSCIAIATIPHECTITIEELNIRYDKTGPEPFYVNVFNTDELTINISSGGRSYDFQNNFPNDSAYGIVVDLYNRSLTIDLIDSTCTSFKGPEKEEIDLDASPEVFFEVAEMARFNFRGQSINEFIVNNVVYPKEAMYNEIQGKVMVEFVIEKDGSVLKENIRIVSKELGYGLEKEAIRIVLATSGHWIPAKQKGEHVRIRYRLPFDFKLY